MKIIVLDASPLDNNDLDWAPLRQFGELVLHPNSAPHEVADRIGEADIVFTNKVPLDAAAFASAPQLRFVGVLATGYNIIDVEAARKNNVVVCNVPGYSADFTAQTTIALLLELTHHVGAHDAKVRDKWPRASAFSYWDFPLVELAGQKLLIVGLGNIGRRVARIGAAFDMKVVSATLPGRESLRHSDPEFPRAPLDEVLPQADIISLHCPLSPETQNLMNAARLKLLKPTALLINTARGPLIDEVAVAGALRENRLAGYACDVLRQEPPPTNNPLFAAPNCIITPHLSWASLPTRKRLLHISAENLGQFLHATPQNVVS